MLLIWATSGIAGPCESWVTQVVSIQGTVEVNRLAQSRWARVKLNDRFCAGDTVRADIHSRAGLLLRNGTLLRLDQGTTLILPAFQEEDSAWLELLRGAVHLISNNPYQLKVKTPFMNAAIEGTEFAVCVSETATKVWVIEGRVLVENPQGTLRLGPGKAALAEAGKAPVPYLKITPRDAVQWALYYPPIIDYRPGAAADPERQRAIGLYRTGQIPAAIQALNTVPGSARDSSFYTQRAAILLSVGEVQSALSDVEQALRLSPGSGTPVALQSIIALTRNDKEHALSLAEQAVKLEPESPTPRVALSYARQAAFDIEGAKESIQKALELSPNDPLAWARLSELELSTGELDEALEAGQKAEALDPDLSHTQMVLGFARLLQIDIDEAKESFNKAIELDPSAPLPRLGMGLAKIRQGDVEEGTKDIEVAAILDPENSLVRSYLGKAYYEEKRGNVASREYEIAKKLDPNDPTPWFYDAIQKQTTNRPVEALHDMQKAIELNDNRAVYRSSLHLDDDLAARSASLGRIYNDLGFQNRGLFEGWRSVTTEPTNYSAHRLLADNYAALPRHEIARVSELLQSQLLQPINLTPVQPQLAASNLLILDGLGPAVPSFNEFNPLFARNRFALQMSGVAGTNNALGDELVQSGLWNKFSYSLGQFHSETAGYRTNNNLNHNLYNAFVQGALNPEISLQAEYRYSEIDHGDIQMHFDPVDDDPTFRRNLRTDTARVGLRYGIYDHSTFIASGIFQKQNEKTPNVNFDNQGYIGEAQYLFHLNHLSLILGGGYFYQDVHAQVPIFNIDRKFGVDHANGYVYSYLRYPDQLTSIFGVSYDKFNDGLIGNASRFNPKLGLIWNITRETTFRFAGFQTLKRPLLADLTIEPVQVAGFNQDFDDRNGTVATRFGIAIDQKFTPDFYGGITLSTRDLRVPIANLGNIDKWNEKLLGSYAYWTISPSFALGIEYTYEKFERENFSQLSDSFPTTSTHIVPATLRYFHTSGFFGFIKGTYVNQNTVFATKSSGIDDFYLVDLGVGFRFPRRFGIFNLTIRNIFDQRFRYQGDGLRTTQEDQPMFLPERSIVGQVTLAY